jgi:hypothetical protein
MFRIRSGMVEQGGLVGAEEAGPDRHRHPLIRVVSCIGNLALVRSRPPHGVRVVRHGCSLRSPGEADQPRNHALEKPIFPCGLLIQFDV